VCPLKTCSEVLIILKSKVTQDHRDAEDVLQRIFYSWMSTFLDPADLFLSGLGGGAEIVGSKRDQPQENRVAWPEC
jgi:hypothetical protein